jgi:hypothetical protein
MAYHAMFASHLRFGLIAWGAVNATYKNKIFVLQKKAIRLINKLPPQESCRPRQYFIENAS